MTEDARIMHKTILKLRPFDFLYDSTCTFPSEKNFKKTAAHAAAKLSEKDIRPCFDSMFSDVGRYPRIQRIYRTENIPLSWTDTTTKTFPCSEVNGKNMVQYVARSTSDVLNKLRLEQLQQTTAHTVRIDGFEGAGAPSTGEAKKSAFPAKRKFCCTRGTQTDYRDSETQTDDWMWSTVVGGDIRHEISLCFQSESEIPVLDDIDVLHEQRKMNELEQKLSTSKRNLSAQIAITKQIQRIKWLLKEKRIDYVNEIRMEFAESKLIEHNCRIQTTITEREEAFTKSHETLKNQKLQTLKRKKERELRKIQQTSQSTRCASMLAEYT